MDPAEYEARYHAIDITDLRMGLLGAVDIRRYIAGWPAENMGEYMNVLSVIATWLKLKGPTLVPGEFSIPNNPRVDPSEIFYKATLRRAFEGRAAPDEIRDAIRLSFLTGRFRFPVAAQAHADRWFGLDCNTFVGNYCGISPSTAISAYARGYRRTELGGATQDVLTSMGLLPMAPVASLDQIRPGTVLVTFGTPDKKGNRWRHIALVQSFTPAVGMTAAGGGSGAYLSLAEWGRAGNSDAHIVAPALVHVKPYACPELPGQTCLAYPGHDPSGGPGQRIFLDASRFDAFEVRGFQVYNADGVPTWNT